MTPLLLLALIAPADSPIEPIPSETIESLIDSADCYDLCAQMAEMGTLLLTIEILVETPGLADTLGTSVIAMGRDNFEDGWGPGAALTLEAEEVFEGWAGACMGVGV